MILSISNRGYFRLKTTIFLLGFLFLVPSIVHGQSRKEQVSSLKNKKVVYVWGGWKNHHPEKTVDLFVPWLRSEGAIVEVFNTLEVYADTAVMEQADLIIQQWTMGEMTKNESKGLQKAILNGTGMAGWHGGTGDSFRGNLNYQYMIGGQFVSHPGGKSEFTVKIIDRKDPITKGLKDFYVKNTEQYYMLMDPNVKVLATSKFTKASYLKKGSKKSENVVTGSVVPVVWKKNFGKGRIFYNSLGHNIEDFDVPVLMEIHKRGIRWAAESKYKAKEDLISPVHKY
jgi:type 1 glutamine amidotransferase|tara:strand:- start:532 stop:1383 length:852 start_codon:yes stop_codon:yes gene_type:complete